MMRCAACREHSNESKKVLHDWLNWKRRGGNKISRSICFTISQYNYRSLGAMPDVARSLGLGSIAIVPYYYFPEIVGQQYEEELRSLGCNAFSWVGFHHEDSGVDFDEFQRQYRQYLASLGDVYSYPYMPLDEEQYQDLVRGYADTGWATALLECRKVDRYPAGWLGEFLRGFRGLFFWECQGSQHRGTLEQRTGRALPPVPA